MARAWDIIPPRPKPTRRTVATRKKSNKASVFFGLIIVVLVIIFVVSATENLPTEIDGVATISPQKSPVKSEEEIPTAEKSADKLLIKILNGTGRSEETNEVSEILTAAGFKIAKTENALNLYDQTIVYYEPYQEKHAQAIAQSLAKYEAKTQKFSQEVPYDLIIVIGAR